jgi:hypothetical protein
MSIKLTDTQLVLLGAAAQRKDLCLVAPPTLKGDTAHKVASKLISAGLAKEVKAKASDPIWRRDEESGGAVTRTKFGRLKVGDPDSDSGRGGGSQCPDGFFAEDPECGAGCEMVLEVDVL